MRFLRVTVAALLLMGGVSARAGTSVPCGNTLDKPLRAEGHLIIDSRPAGLAIVGTDQETLHVTCMTDDRDNTEDLHFRYSGSADGGTLSITGGTMHHGGYQIRIEVPRRTGLRVRMGAGEVDVQEIAGDKDIELYAGQITITGHAWDYRSVSASVDIGEVDAPVYGADKGGFFRSLSKQFANGEYRLHAHVMTGEVDLRGVGASAKVD